MIAGNKQTKDDVLYTVFKKHFCPDCSTRLKRKKTTVVVSPNSPEAKEYNIDPYIIGEVKVQVVDLYCPTCQRVISIEDMKRIEGKYVVEIDDDTVENPDDPV